MDKNHIHLLCGAHPEISPGRIVQIFKSITAREIFCTRPEVKKELWSGEFWTDGYYVTTVGERGNWKTVENYIERQGKPREDLRQLRLFCAENWLFYNFAELLMLLYQMINLLFHTIFRSDDPQ